MVPDVSTGERTRGLLSYLFGPGRREEHTDAHIVAAFALPGLPDPGRTPIDEHQDVLSELADYLDQPVRLREQRTGKKVPQHVWHCPVRTAPGDRYLTDEEWAEVARRIVHATGIAPHGDDAACRWIAVRHADDHIHILATSVREDGRRPRNKRDGQRAQAECRRIEKELGLRRLKSGDGTAPKTPTSAERAKAQRAGRELPVRQWLREHAYAAAAATRNEEEFFAVLTALGIKVRPRLGPETGEVTGYSLAAPEDDNAQGEPIYYGGSTLAPDLSLNRLRERFTAQTDTNTGAASAARTVGTGRHGTSWRRAESELRTTYAFLAEATDDRQLDALVQAQAAAFGELLYNAAAAAPRSHRAELRAAAAAFNRANYSAIRAQHQHAAALRSAGKELVRSLGGGQDGDGIAGLLYTAIYVLIALHHWHEARGHQQQAAAAHQALTHLQAGYQQAAEPLLANLTRRAPHAEVARRFEADLRHALPEHADRILADPAWPALTTTLAKAESAGHRPRQILTEAAEQRELDTADSPAQVLNWRIATAPNKRAMAARARSTTVGPVTAAPTPSGAVPQRQTPGPEQRSFRR